MSKSFDSKTSSNWIVAGAAAAGATLAVAGGLYAWKKKSAATSTLSASAPAAAAKAGAKKTLKFAVGSGNNAKVNAVKAVNCLLSFVCAPFDA
jgi:hypothetical protein